MEQKRKRGRPHKVLVVQTLSANEQRVQEIMNETKFKLQGVLFTIKRDLSAVVQALANVQGTSLSKVWKEELSELSNEWDYRDFTLSNVVKTQPKKRGRPRKQITKETTNGSK
jgi:hypothetical protein